MFVDRKSRRRINTSEKYRIDCVCTAHRCLIIHRHWHAKICFSNPCYQQAVVTGWETKAGRNLSQWIIESADLQPIKMLILSNELFPVLREWVVLHCALHHTVRNWLLIYSVQCILDCLPVASRIEPAYSLLTASGIHINYISCPQMGNLNDNI